MNVEDDPRMKKAAMEGLAENQAIPGMDREYARGYVHGFEAAEAAGAVAPFDPNDLTIVLEYAYQGLGSASCVDDRAEDCPICDALTALENYLRPLIPEDEMPVRGWSRIGEERRHVPSKDT
jgi:hypothetical protein